MQQVDDARRIQTLISNTLEINLLLQLQLWTNGTLEEYLPATTFGAPASSTAGHVGWREGARNRGILHSHSGA